VAISNLTQGLRPGICTSTTRPTAPYEGQAIYETDTDKVLVWNGSAWYPNWNLPWGLVATPVRKTTSQSSIAALADVTDMTLTFTGVAGRWYKATYTANGGSTVSGTTFRFTLTNASNTLTTGGIYDHSFPSTNSSTVVAVFYFQVTGSATRKIRVNIQAGSGTMTLYADSNIPATYTIEDIGPA